MQRLVSIVGAIPLVKSMASVQSTAFQQKTQIILPTFTPLMDAIRGMKIKGVVRRRCKFCYTVTRDERLYVMCSKFPRHKQMSMKPKPLNTWILTHASQSPVRPW